nr:biotin/lipoyl-binding protein [Pectobacterium colocasium]
MAVLIWLLAGRTNEQENAPQGQWLPVQPQLLENQLGLVGRIQAAMQTTLAAPFEGVIREVLAREGQRVEEGQTLLILDPGKLRFNCVRLRLTCSRRSARYKRSGSGNKARRCRVRGAH